MIEMECPHCNIKIEVDDEYAGKSVKCGACQKRITFPGVLFSDEEDLTVPNTGPNILDDEGDSLMAIMKCPKCGNQINSSSTECKVPKGKPYPSDIESTSTDLLAHESNIDNQYMVGNSNEQIKSDKSSKYIKIRDLIIVLLLVYIIFHISKIEENVDSMEYDIRYIQSDVSSIQWDVSSIQSDVE